MQMDYLIKWMSLNFAFLSLMWTLFVTETHLSEEIADAELQIEGYSFHRGDRKFNLHTEVINKDISDGGRRWFNNSF